MSASRRATSPPAPAVRRRRSAARPPVAPEEGERLAIAFRSFVRVSRKLERAYDRLRARCERIDFALGKANAELRGKVAELDALTRYLEGLLSGLPVAVVVSSAANRLELVNPAAAAVLRRSAASLHGADASAVRGADGRPLLLTGVPEASAEATDVEREIEPEPGRRVRVVHRLSDVRGSDGTLLARIETLQDVTETRRLEDRVRYLDAMAAVGEMAAVVAHEIRSPLNGVLGFAGLLRRSLDGTAGLADARRFAGRVEDGVRRVEKTVNDLLSYARPESLEAEPVPLAALLDESLEEAAAGAPLGRVRVVRVKRSDVATALGDAAALRRVFTNLIRNAIEAMTPEGGAASGRLVLRAGARGGEAWASVRDEGCGISPELRRRLFSPFATGRPRGVGLGLATVLKLVSLQGGRVAVESEPGRGAEFVVTLPRAPRARSRNARKEIRA
jgi:signal transduction histidine kinase